MKFDSSDYNADSIIVLSYKEFTERFEWAMAPELARQYNRPIEWIERGLEACRRSGEHPNYFIDRYLNEDKSILINPLVNDAIWELIKEQSGSQYSTKSNTLNFL